jgi:molybdenum cofactor synthesis domain-containing protein
MTEDSKVTAAVLIIGDEILSGRTADRNINLIARHLAPVGISLREVRVVADDEADIVAAVDALRERYDYVFTTGGIGPTHDDITADSMATAFGVGIDIDPRAVDMMRGRYSEEQLHGDRLRMARIPTGAELVANPVSQTPGFMLGNVIVMAGIPDIMVAMLNEVTPRLRRGAPILSRTLRVMALESCIAAPLREVQKADPFVAIGSYPFVDDGRFGAHLVLRSSNEARLDAARSRLVARLQEAGFDCEDVPGEAPQRASDS